MVLSVSHAPPPQPQQPLDRDLRGYLDTNKDVVTRITKPVSIEDIGALAAQSEQPILFENIIEKPGFRLCDIFVKHRQLHARALGVKREHYLRTLTIVYGCRRGASPRSKPDPSRRFAGLARTPI
jgi:hypothetical protein